MIVKFESAEDETTLDMRPEWPIPRVGEYLDWRVVGPNQLPQGVYRVGRVTYLFTHGTMQVGLGVELVASI